MAFLKIICLVRQWNFIFALPFKLVPKLVGFLKANKCPPNVLPLARILPERLANLLEAKIPVPLLE